MQHRPGKEIQDSRTPWIRSPGGSIEICDSPYHILATNVNTLPLRHPEIAGHPLRNRLLESPLR